MKKFRNVVLLLVGVLYACSHSTQAVSASRDQNYLPITSSELLRQMGRNKNNVIGMVQLLRRADEQKIGDVAFDWLKTMRTREPNNALVHAAYCFAHDYEFQKTRAGGARIRGRTGAEQEAFRVSLERAYKLAPRLWLTYVVDANRRLFQFSESPFPTTDITNSAFALLQKAVRLAPHVSFTHYYLANANDLTGLQGNWRDYDEAVSSLKTAIRLQPALADAALLLLDIREVRVPNPKEAKWAVQQLIRLIAVGSPASPYTRKRLAKYGLKLSW